MLKVLLNFIKNKYKPKNVQFQLSNKIVYDLKIFNTDEAIPYAKCIYRTSKLSGKHNRDITQREYEKCRKDCIVFKGTDRISFNQELKELKDNFKVVVNVISDKHFKSFFKNEYEA